MNAPATLDLSRPDIIERDFIWLPAARPSVRQIISEVAQRRDLTPGDLVGQSRLRRIAQARQEAMWEIRQRTRFSTTQIGIFLGKRDHTTVMHGIRRHAERIGEGA